MYIHCLGLSHVTAPVALRERLAFNEEAVKAALARLGCGSLQEGAVGEMVILSTCNRVEIYAAAPQEAFDELEHFLSESRRTPAAEFRPHLYRLSTAEAAAHLLKVAAGLDSLVLGEPQILGQVTHALELARSQATAGLVLSRLFQTAIHAGKRVRTETTIAHNPSSISSVAVRLAAQVAPELNRASVIVLGAGEMAEMVVEALRKRGAGRITVVNRTLERARLLAGRWGGEAATFESLPELLSTADILISSTGAPHTMIHKPLVEETMRQRPSRPLVMIDIAVPRDIDEEAAQIPCVKVYDLDDLQDHLALSMEERMRQLPGAEAILEEEHAMFMEYMGCLDLLPLIRDLHEQAEDIRRAELSKTLRRMPDLSPEERRRVEALTQALVKKLLHEPITRLRAEAQCPQGSQYAAVARSLFGLYTPSLPDEDPSTSASSSSMD